MPNPFLSVVEDDSSYVFDDHVRFIVDHVMDGHFDAVYMTTGYPGFGKSSFVIDFNRRISVLTGQTFSVKPVDAEGGGGNVVYPGQLYESIHGGLRYLGRGSCIQIDEGIDQGDKRNSMTKGQKAIMAFMDQVRFKGFFFNWLYRHRSVADLRIKGRALFEVNVKTTPKRDEAGILHMERGRFDFWWDEKLGNLGPFEDRWFDHVENIPFDSLEGDPEFEEYNYYKDMFTTMAWAGWEAPWKEFAWRPGAKVPSVEEMIPYADATEEARDQKLQEFVRQGRQILEERANARGWKGKKSPRKEDDESWR